MDLQAVRGVFALVLQDVQVFSGTVAENVRLGIFDNSPTAYLNFSRQFGNAYSKVTAGDTYIKLTDNWFTELLTVNTETRLQNGAVSNGRQTNWRVNRNGRNFLAHYHWTQQSDRFAVPLGILGGGENLEVIHGDAYYQSYICRIPRSTLELGVTGRLDVVDGMIFPFVCDVIRNLSGMWKLMFPNVWSKFFDTPQNFDPAVGGVYYRRELAELVGVEICAPSRLRRACGCAAVVQHRRLPVANRMGGR